MNTVGWWLFFGRTTVEQGQEEEQSNVLETPHLIFVVVVGS